MFTLTSNHNLKYEYAKALQVCDLLSNWVHPSQMPAFTSKDKWWLEVSKNKKNKKRKKLMKRGISRYSKGWEKFIFWQWRVLYLLKPYLFFIALTIAIHHKPNKDLLILGNIFFYISGEWFNKQAFGVFGDPFLFTCLHKTIQEANDEVRMIMRWSWVLN